MSDNDIQPIKQAVEKANDIIVLLAQDPNHDVVAAGMGVYHALKQPGKNVFIATPKPINTEEMNIPDIEQITHKLGNRNLVISLQVESRESIDKVSYNLDEESKVFNLVIQPRKGNPPLKTNDIEYSYSGVQADLVITLGAQRFEDFGSFYQNEKDLFTDATTLSITTPGSGKFTNLQFTQQGSSLSAAATGFIDQVFGNLTPASATSLLFGINASTENLQSSNVNADTFELVAKLMRAGGKRPNSASAPTQPTNVPANPHNAGPSNVPKDWLSPKIYSGSSQSAQRKG